MTIYQLAEKIGAKIVTEGLDQNREVTCGYACDLLSWVMAHGEMGMAWVTVQAHMNVIAVAVLSDMACVIAAEGVQFEADVVQKAQEEGVALLACEKSAYAIAGLMHEAGIA